MSEAPPSEQDVEPQLQAEVPVPSFAGMDFVKGVELRLRPDGSTILVLDVWATHASNSATAGPFLSAVQARFPAPSVIVVGVTTESVRPALVQSVYPDSMLR